MSSDKEIVQKVLDSIESQKGDCNDDEVYVIEIMSLRFKAFTQSIKQSLERFSSLQMLTINDCLLDDLSNFPHIPSLIRLDLVFNQIKGDQLGYLRGSRHLQSLMIGANAIAHTSDLRGLGQMRELIQLDLLNNPVVMLDGYRDDVFQMFPSLVILDTLDKKGIDQEKAQLEVSAARIPQNLFEAPKSKQQIQKKTPIVKPQKSQPVVAAGSVPQALKPKLAAVPAVKAVAPAVVAAQNAPRKSPAARSAAAASKLGAYSKKTTSIKSGLTFPCGRIRRYLKERCKEFRISSASNVYLAAVLEYLTAEVLETAGNYAKNNRLRRITPVHIRETFRNDQELNEYAKGVVISEGGSTSSHFKMPNI